MVVVLQEKGKKVFIIDFDIGMGNIDVLIGAVFFCIIIDVMENWYVFVYLLFFGLKGFCYIFGGIGFEVIY